MAYSLALGSVSFLLAVVWGGPLIRLLIHYRIGKQIRIDGPRSHQVKMGTPTMGGLMIIVPVFLITVGLNIANLLGRTIIGQSILVPLAVLIGYGLLGAIDDLRVVRNSKGLGLSVQLQFALQIGIAILIALALHYGLDLRSVALPTVPQKIDIGLWYLPIATFIIVGSCNAVNLTDGLDGLAGMNLALAFAAYGVIAHLQGQIYLVKFCFTLVGAVMAFLWYNAYPADLFMGGTGSLSLGATLGVVALMTGQWLLLPIVALVPVVEVVSVILQVGWFKATDGKRLFKMAPLHHHFELLGWSEPQVTQRLLLMAIWSAMLGIALALV
ncbi:MAG: phospho-N-acetylmuramoyl-pentapeptide-transferase [Chloroflexota bacterium]|nr:phospho-N-acetylmuramoyl-pentapeptide-transferase [Chloroflexota bacterium]